MCVFRWVDAAPSTKEHVRSFFLGRGGLTFVVLRVTVDVLVSSLCIAERECG